MKTHVLIAFLSIVFGVCFTQAQTAVLDDNFENYLETHNKDGGVVPFGDETSMGDGLKNNRVDDDRINQVVTLSVSNLNITDLTGIVGFTSLKTLICSNNKLTELEVLSNLNLKTLICSLNLLTELDVRANDALEVLDCSGNQLTSLVLQEGGVAGNPLLKRLTCSNNQLQNIDVSQNINLTSLAVSENQISGALDVSANVSLEYLFCASNQISTLNLDSNSVLKNLDASNNFLTTLDLSQINTLTCPATQTNPPILCQGDASINVSRNKLIDLNIVNGFNSSIVAFNAEDNPDLACILIDAGFVPPNAGNLAWVKDDWTYYTDLACANIYTYVPDENFEAALINLGHDTLLTPEHLVLTATISTVTNLPISGENISDLTGIEDFVALTSIDCSDNDLKILDLSANINLTSINCSVNILSSLDVSANTILENLNCSGQIPYDDVDDDTKDYTFDTLNIRGNTALLELNCSNNNLSALSVNSNTALTNLNCSFNAIEAINVNANPDLQELLCNNNSLFALNVVNGNNGAISLFNADFNPNLSCIEVDALTVPGSWMKDANSSYSLACGTYVPDDNFETYLETHDATGMLVTIGDPASMGDGIINNFVPTVSINTVTNLNVSSRVIADLTGIEDFVALTNLNCSDNSITYLDLAANTALLTVNCSSNAIKNLDFSLNTTLTNIDCNDNDLFTLSIKNVNIAGLTQFNTSANSNLYCIEVDDKDLADAKPTTDWIKDNRANYSFDCAGRFTTILDDNFEQVLIDLGLDFGPLDDMVLTANIEHLLNLDVSDRNIADLSGIQDFSGLKELDCSGNSLNELNVSNMVNLEFLNCNSNYLLTNNTANVTGVLNTDDANNLKRLFCASNLLADLNVSNKILLEELDCGNNNIVNLDITLNPKLKIINCSNNNLVTLDISQNIELVEVTADNNAITSFTTIGVNNAKLKKLSCSYNSIKILDVTNYLNLETLNCRSNKVSKLDVTAHPALLSLDFTNNNIDEIDLLNNTSLVSFLGSQNNLTTLDLTANIVLETINCDNNDIESLVIDSVTSLKYLYGSGNKLTDLDVSNNTNLVELNVSSNALSNITLSTNLSELKTFNCSDNVIVSNLDLSSIGTAVCPPPSTDPNNPEDYCPSSITINVSGNTLSVLNIQNALNENISSFNATNNPDLDCIQVDDENTIGEGWLKDPTASYKESCRFGETYVPDDNFETRLIALGYDTLPLDDYVLTSEIENLTLLDVSGESIVDLTGIEDFVALEMLNCSGNDLTELDINKNVALAYINCSDNNLLNIDFSSNTALSTINCSGNLLFKLDLTMNSNVLNLNISNNSFTRFLPSRVPLLEDFNCDSNQITELNLSSNSGLTALSCESNLLETLNLKNGQNVSLANLNVQNNADLTCIETDTGNKPNGVTWLKDTTTEYQIDCHYGLTYVPDNAFEQALIDKGLDLGSLDDYVPTSRIETFSNLDISNNIIEDLTGLEDFIGLKKLNFSNNAVSELDLSKNILLEELNAFNNTLTNIDLSLNPILEVLNISGNSLSEIDLNANTNLLELDVSGNQLTVLNVDALVDLQFLDCSSNVLESLSVELNPQLVNLYCQDNSFVSDQLNLQNGANQSLTNFNATDNPDLACILVDDPFTVITNAGGVYDNWIKDVISNYQSVCEDADNDGVANADDQCLGTPFGDTVDLFGCTIFNLPNNNFTVLITGETCLNNNNGKINITTLEYYNYKATLINDNFNKEYNFTNEIDILNLLAGSYQMCITIEEQPNYISCYDVVINQPEPLGVLTNKSVDGKSLSINMSGSSSYNINFNGLKFNTSDSSLTLSLQEGENRIKVFTDVECQGFYEETILVSDSVFVYPNPFQQKINLYTGNSGSVNINVYSYLGQLVYSNHFMGLKSNEVEVDTSSFSKGIYVITVKTESIFSTFKIVKK